MPPSAAWAPPGPIPHPPSGSFILSFPAPHTLLLTINRPDQMNSLPSYAHWEAARIFDWFDHEPALRTAVITGAGPAAFCAGQDLIEQGRVRVKYGGGAPPPDIAAQLAHPPSGFAGMTCRVGRKPIIAAVNGYALGGGFEVVLNCDMTVASPTAVFGLPEALRGLFAAAGGLPRLVRNVGLPVANEIALAGRQLSAQEALELRLINQIAASPESVLDEALALAGRIVELSPDAVIATKGAIRQAWETSSVDRASAVARERYQIPLFMGENIKIGLEAFARKQKPVWKESNL